MIKIPRISRKDLNTPFLHVMVQGINKEYIFKNRKYIETYLSLFRRYIKEYNVTMIAYCIMNNHAHFLTYAEIQEELSKLMHKVNLVYSQFYNKDNNRCGMVFRNRYKSEPIYNLSYLINCIQYIHLNPVKAKIVEKCEDYLYSSYNDYMRNGNITKSKIMIEIFGKDYNYKEIFDNKVKYMLNDIDEPNQKEIKEYMDIAIDDFLDINMLKLEDVLSNKEVLCKIIKELRNTYHFKYTDIMKKFDIPNTRMQKLK